MGWSAFSPASRGPGWHAAIATAGVPSGAVRSRPAVLTSSGQPAENSSNKRSTSRPWLRGVDHHAAKDRADRMEPILKRRHDTEIRPGAPHTPEEILVLARARRQKLSIGGDDVHR